MQRGLGGLVAAGVAIAAACLVPLSPAHAEQHDGWCREGEGQAVVVDPNPPVPFGPALPVIIRCIVLPGGPGATSEYPQEGPFNRASVLESAGIPYRLNASGLVVDIAGHETPDGYYWHYVRGRDGAWLGRDAWDPEPVVDTMVGIRLTQREAAPVVVPKLLPAPQPPPSDEPSPGPSGGPSPGPSGEPSAGPSPGPTGEPSAGPTGEPSAGPTGEPTAGPTAAPTGTPPGGPSTPPPPQDPPRPTDPSRQPPPTTAPSEPRRTSPGSPDRPSQPPTSDRTTTPPEDDGEDENTVTPPTQDPDVTVSPSLDPQDTTVVADASPSPSRVWGKESSVRTPNPTPAPEGTAPWAPWLVALAGLVLVGGLGSGFLGSRNATTPLDLEDE